MAHLVKFFILFAMLSFATLNNAIAQETVTTVEKHVIITPTPEPKEVIIIPEGYSNCFVVEGGWFQNIWIPEHRVCQYQTPGKSTWVEGHWACTAYNASTGECTKWDWRAARWSDTLVVY